MIGLPQAADEGIWAIWRPRSAVLTRHGELIRDRGYPTPRDASREKTGIVPDYSDFNPFDVVPIRALAAVESARLAAAGPIPKKARSGLCNSGLS
jgi:hypothetical protein